ncbi:MAG: hypothetical protein QGG36_09005, partial [Pirellulaceae bacterium]|nr:hypothetical protein [Pirellulaceae bacterium]
MIRLAVLGDESEVDSVAHECLSVADRLRGATLSAVANLEQLGGGFDAVVVCGRDGAVQASASAAQRSLHVLLTHLPSSTASANELRELERLNGVRVVTSSVQRFLPATQAIKQSLASGQLGDAGLLRIHRWRAATREAALADDLDTAIWLFDSMPTEVFALQRPTKNEGEYLQVHLGFLAGGMAMIDCCSGLPTANGYFSMSLIG